MKRLVLFLVLLSCQVGCTKADEESDPTTILDVGIQYNASYQIQQFLQTSSNPSRWDYVDLQGPVIVQFLNDSVATERHDTLIAVKRKFMLSERTVIQKPKGIQYTISFLEGPACVADTCPKFIIGQGIIFGQFQEIICQKQSSNNFDGFRFIKQ